MKATVQTIQQVERAIKKIAQKFPMNDDVSILTDIHIRVSQDTGELVAFDDNEEEITRCVVEQWIDYKADDFYPSVCHILQTSLKRLSSLIDNLGILKPYSFVLEDDDKENIAELYLADDDTIIVGSNLMKDWDKDLDTFMENLLK